MPNRSRVRKGAVAVGALSLLAVTAVPASGASHREAPLTAADPQIDATDLYAFVSPDAQDTVTLVSNWIPFQEPAGGPNFYLWGEGVQYDINIDNNGDAKADIVYRWTFKTNVKNKDTFLYNVGPVTSLKDDTLNIVQTYNLERIAADGKAETLVTDAIVAPSFVGKASMPDYGKLRNEAVTPLSNGKGKSFAGQADDPFFLDLRIFDLLYGADLSETGDDTLDGYNVNTLAVQVPKSDLAVSGDANANPVVGVWTTASRPGTRVLKNDGTVKGSGNFVQVSRLGNPLVNEVVVPLQFKNAFNGSTPDGDSQFLPKVQDPEVPKLIEKIYKMPAPATPRDDLVSVFLTGVEGLNKPANVTPSEQLRLNMSIPPAAAPDRMGVVGGDKAGFPNGRRLDDDVIDVALQVMMGELKGSPNDLGDGVNANDVASVATFPYVGLPHSGSDAANTQVKGVQLNRSSAPAGGVAAGGGGTSGNSSSIPSVPLTAAVAGIVLMSAVLINRRRVLN
ncbi:MAG TPA: DUF4331 domain-containing protein [Acidimicrobiales bacterium]|nr:DUF4331 domain-containing protein [Acidimicrobiales bacterium]